MDDAISTDREVLLLPSGRVGDVTGSHEDARLIREIAVALDSIGLTITIVNENAAYDECGWGMRALQAAVERSNAPALTLLGHSRGAETVLLLASSGGDRRIRSLILLGAVVEKPTILDLSVVHADLILGSDDFVAYVDDQGIMETPRAAELHGQKSISNLIFAGDREADLTLLQGVGHAMRDRSGSAATALDAICRVTRQHLDPEKA